MRRSRYSIILTIISIILVFISFFFTSLLDSFSAAFVYVFGIIFILFGLLAAFLAYRERTEPGWDPWSGSLSPSSARSFCLFGAGILITILIVFLSPIGIIWEMEDIPAPIDKSIYVIGLWIVSSLLIIVAALLYEDPKTKSWI